MAIIQLDDLELEGVTIAKAGKQVRTDSDVIELFELVKDGGVVKLPIIIWEKKKTKFIKHVKDNCPTHRVSAASLVRSGIKVGYQVSLVLID